MILALEIAIVLFAYILGSIPMGYYLTKIYTGHNILDHGSGNIGSTNVNRVAGKKISIITQLFDMMKGLLPVALVQILLYYNILSPTSYYIYLVALATIIGHDFSIFLGFKGGRGVNTTLGASLLLSPIPVLGSVLIYYMVKWITKYVSLSSILLGISLPIIAYAIDGLSELIYYLIICALLITVRHSSNITRLINGTEPTTRPEQI